MAYALMSSGGKDSTLALDRARRRQLDVRFLANIHDGATGRVAFHGVRAGLIAAQATAQGLHYLGATTGPDPYEEVFVRMLHTLVQRDVTGVVFGNIHLADVRAWYEERVTGAGLEHVEPLWGDPPGELLQEVVDRGFRGIVVSVDLEQGADGLLGQELGPALVEAVEAAGNIDPCGERGEYHTFVYDGPTFGTPVRVRRGETVTQKGHRLLNLALEP